MALMQTTLSTPDLIDEVALEMAGLESYRPEPEALALPADPWLAPPGWDAIVEEATRHDDTVCLSVERWHHRWGPTERVGATVWSARLDAELRRCAEAGEPTAWPSSRIPVPGGDDPLGDVLMIYRAYLSELDALEAARARAYGLDVPGVP